MKYVALIILLAVTTRNGAEKQLPNYIVRCEAGDEKCLKNTLEALKPHLMKGIKEFQLPSIVPLHFPDFNYSKNIPPDVDYSVSFTNIEFGKVDDYKVSKISVDLIHLKFLLALNFTELTLTMNEKAYGKAFGVEVNWNRTAQISFKNLTINISLDGTQVFKEGKRYVNWRKDNVDISAGSIIYDVENLSNYRDLQTALSQKIHQKREFIDGEVRFIVKNTLAESIFHIINVVHDTYPVNVLYTNQ